MLNSLIDLHADRSEAGNWIVEMDLCSSASSREGGHGVLLRALHVIVKVMTCEKKSSRLLCFGAGRLTWAV